MADANPQLEAIVQKMIDAGEPEDAIASVIQQFSAAPPHTPPQGGMLEAVKALNPVPLMTNPDYRGGFLRSAGQTAATTAKGVGEGVLSSLNPINLIRGPWNLVKDVATNQGQDTLAGLKAIASGDPEIGGQAIGGLLTSLAVPRVAGAIRSRIAGASVEPSPGTLPEGPTTSPPSITRPIPGQRTMPEEGFTGTTTFKPSSEMYTRSTPAASPQEPSTTAPPPAAAIRTKSPQQLLNEEAIGRWRAAAEAKRAVPPQTPDLSGSALGKLPNDAEMVADLQRRAAAGGKSLMPNFGPGGPLGPEGGFYTSGMQKILSDPRRIFPALAGAYLGHQAGISPYIGAMAGSAAPELASGVVRGATSPFGQAALRAALLAKIADEAKRQSEQP